MVVVGVLRIALAVFTILSIKKISLNASNSVCYSLCPEEATDLQETYIGSSFCGVQSKAMLSFVRLQDLFVVVVLKLSVDLNQVKCVKHAKFYSILSAYKR